MTLTASVPSGVAQVTTPSGLEIYYQAAPKRLYRVNGFEVPSVSTITDVISKPLQWYGMKVGIEGILRLCEFYSPEEILSFTHEGLVDLLTAHKLTVNHDWSATNRATTRGTNVHRALEAYADDKTVPDPRFYPESERGYVAGVAAFIQDAHPHPLMSEVMVASLDGYAGRFDLICNLDFAGEVVTKLYPKRAPKREHISGSWLIDLKTSTGVWPSYHFQVAGYMAALEECGYPVPEHAGILRVTDDGKYELVECRASYDDFTNALALYTSLQALK